MRIALNLLYVTPDLAGGRVYADGLLRGLAALPADHEYTVFTRRGIDLPAGLPADRFRHWVAPVPAGSTLWRTFWEYNLLPRQVRRGGYDLLHGLGSLSPAAKTCPLVLTIHDVIYRRFPDSQPRGHRVFMDLMGGRTARRAGLVIVPSRWTAGDVTDLLGVPESRVRVVPNGPGQRFAPSADAEGLRPVLAKYRLAAPYILNVCRGYPHKNVAGLLRAVALLRRDHPDVRLVQVGDEYKVGGELQRLTDELDLRRTVTFTGPVPDGDLNAIFCGAALFAFPSLAEGFGLPVIEAMTCGTPVVASDAAAIPEVVGDAGLLADATDPEAFAAAMGRVLGDDTFAAELRRRGLARAAEFSWEECARRSELVYREAL